MCRGVFGYPPGGERVIGLCDQTVTVYRKDARMVVRNCFYHQSTTREETLAGAQERQTFLLITKPGSYVPKIGDRVYPGIGPEKVDWETFLPCTVAGLGEIAYVTPWYFGGTLHHFESGRH